MKRRLGRLALVALACGCGEQRLLDSFTEGQTRIRLAPSEFTGSVVCERDTPGALRAYMVRFQVVTPNVDGDAGLTPLIASGSVPCDQAVVLPVAASRFYGAEIFGFDRELTASDLETPTGARWTATCGRGKTVDSPDAGLDPLEPTWALRGSTVPMRGCSTFDGATPGSIPTRLAVDTAGALGTLTCGQGAGTVSGFRAVLDGVTRSARCGDPLVFDLPPTERYYTVELTGLEGAGDAGAPGAPDAQAPAPVEPVVGDAGTASDASVDPLDASVGPVQPGDAGTAPAAPVEGVPRWSTRCIGRSLPGLQVPAYCDPLVRLP